LSGIVVRSELSSDYDAIHDLTRRAFAPMPFSDGTEHELVTKLREARALVLSLVALQEDRLVGHVAFTPALPSDDAAGWYGLGPISVEPELQRKGIGRRLIIEGFAALQEIGAKGCILVGDPAYYQKSGFKLAPELAPARQPKEYFMIASFDHSLPSAPIDFHPVFYG
jgi:putative acetyltransferase